MLQLTSILLLLVLTLAPVGAGGGHCYADWSVAAPIVRQEGLVTVESLTKRAKTKISGEIVRTTLCETGGEFVYRLVVREPSGRLATRTVNARAPFGR